jgi:hypothetical protein
VKASEKVSTDTTPTINATGEGAGGLPAVKASEKASEKVSTDTTPTINATGEGAGGLPAVKASEKVSTDTTPTINATGEGAGGLPPVKETSANNTTPASTTPTNNESRNVSGSGEGKTPEQETSANKDPVYTDIINPTQDRSVKLEGIAKAENELTNFTRENESDGFESGNPISTVSNFETSSASYSRVGKTVDDDGQQTGTLYKDSFSGNTFRFNGTGMKSYDDQNSDVRLFPKK